MRGTQRFLLELTRDLILEFLDKTGPLFCRKPSKGFNDLLSIHLEATSHREVTATRR